MDNQIGTNLNPHFFSCKCTETEIWDSTVTDGVLTAQSSSVTAEAVMSYTDQGFSYKIKVTNKGNNNFAPHMFGFDFGIDTYLESYPGWNEKFFPTFFRCEKTHFWGYFMQPIGKVLGVISRQPVASYMLDYNKEPGNYGHRINFAAAVLICKGPLPEHHPQNMSKLAPGEQLEWKFDFCFADNLDSFTGIMTEKYDLPYISADRFTLASGEKLDLKVHSNSGYKLKVFDPDQKELSDMHLYKPGLYTASLLTDAGFCATACFFCRMPWEWYLVQARKEVISKPPHATTHCESWYGFYTGFLAAQHYPDEALDLTVQEMFDEIMPYVFDFNNCRPKLITERVQNVASIIGILVSRYNSNPVKYKNALVEASRFADWLMTRQKSDGAYYRDNIHYTCVIYPAKSMLELVSAERELGQSDDYFKVAAERHYDSAARAVEDLVNRLEDIGTEGEHTLEDGMISCSCLQIACYALTLPENQRKKYIEAAEHMLAVHRCLEHQISPDCRVRGTTVRYWEAQYDITLRKNFITSPHGWSAWLSYALYYLYLLTGKEEYMTQFMDAIGACAQLLGLDGNLRWAFAVDPYIYTDQCLVPDEAQPIKDAYESVKTEERAFRGKFTEKTFGEQYIDMVSGWYRTGSEQKVTGGHYTCSLILEDKILKVDRQGGCCDNDVHEIFKCIEETVLKKAFILERENDSLICWNCSVTRTDSGISVIPFEPIEHIHTNLLNKTVIYVADGIYSVPKGLKMTDL